MRPSPALAAQLEQRCKAAQRTLENVKRQIAHEKAGVITQRQVGEQIILDAGAKAHGIMQETEQVAKKMREQAESELQQARALLGETKSVIGDAAQSAAVEAATLYKADVAESVKLVEALKPLLSEIATLENRKEAIKQEIAALTIERDRAEEINAKLTKSMADVRRRVLGIPGVGQ